MKKKSIERLPDSELYVMNIIWKFKNPVGTGEIVQQLNKEKNWSRSTVQVLLARLEEKGFIQCQRQGRLKYYTSLIEEEIYRSKETKSFLEHFYNNSYKKLIASLAHTNKITDEDIEDIVHIIKEANKEEGR